MSHKVLVIGDGGTGKTYIANKLRELDIPAFDADAVYGLIRWIDDQENTTPWPEKPTKEWFNTHKFIWNMDVLEKLLKENDPLYLFGISDTAFEVLHLFDKTYYLDASPELIRARLSSPSRNNPMGKTQEQRDLIVAGIKKLKKRALKLGLIPLDASLTPEEIYILIS